MNSLLRDSRIVVTGGAGFIGSNLAEALSKENEVVIIDDFSTGKKKNIKSFISSKNVKLIQSSVSDFKLLSKAFKDIDYVFHLAALPSVARSIGNPSLTNEVNVKGTLNVLLAAKNEKIKKLIYTSSTAVYGNVPKIPKKEDMLPFPESPYAISKLAGEHYCRVFYEIYGLPTVSLRYFNIYGPRQDPHAEYAAVIPTFIYRVSKNKAPIIFGDGEQTRDFAYVEDAVQASLKAALSNKANGEVLNVGTGQCVSINGLATLILKLFNKKYHPIHKKPREGDVRHSLADISKARKLIGYEPKYDLEEGLKRTIKHMLQSQ